MDSLNATVPWRPVLAPLEAESAIVAHGPAGPFPCSQGLLVRADLGAATADLTVIWPPLPWLTRAASR
jgi:hypothetical protein